MVSFRRAKRGDFDEQLARRNRRLTIPPDLAYSRPRLVRIYRTRRVLNLFAYNHLIDIQ